MATEVLVPREQVLKRLNVSDSTERRRRQTSQNWPAHVKVGNRILYSESSVNRWIAAQEATNTVGIFSPDIQAAIERRAAELVAQAPPLTPQQVVRLREIFANPAGGGSR